MKISLKKGIAAGMVVAAAGALLAITSYTDTHRILEIEDSSPVTMNASLLAVEEDMEARMEAQEVAIVINKIDTITLASFYELQEARELYEGASKGARAYIDETQLLEAEQLYAELESMRERLLAEAQEEYDIYGILEYASCDVQTSGNEYLDTLVQEFIQKATTADMNRSEQLKACYDYMVWNYDYAYNYNYDYSSGKKSIAWATAFLRDGYGACNNWSSAFMYVARALGYEVDLYYGSTATSRNGNVEHYWPVFRIDGTEYVFDPQVEGDITRRTGVISNKRFGLTGSAADEKYFFSRIVQ